MGKGKKRRRVIIWRATGLVAHAFESPSATSLCRSFGLVDTANVEGGEERCRACEIALDQLWWPPRR